MGEGLEFHRSEGGLIDVGALNVPARREARLVEDERTRGICNGAVMMADHEVTRGLANVDAVVTDQRDGEIPHCRRPGHHRVLEAAGQLLHPVPRTHRAGLA
jgi:hypothetical protein